MSVDLEFLKHRERIERMRAEWGDDISRARHRDRADGYGARIRELAEKDNKTTPE